MADWHTVIIAIFFLLALIIPVNPLSFNYPSFNEDDDLNLELQGDASIIGPYVEVSSATEINRDSAGRVMSSQQMHLWDITSRNLTNFSTNFSLTTDLQSSPASTLAFFLEDPNHPFRTKHSTVAVVFDSYNSYVGMDFNSNSIITKPWSYRNDFNSVYYCSIDYNSTTHNLSVYYTGYDNITQMTQYFSYEVDLTEYLPEWVIVGFSATRVAVYQYKTESDILWSWSFSSTLDDDSQTPRTIPYPNHVKKTKVGLLVGLVISGVVCSIGLVCFLWWKSRKSQDEKEESVNGLNLDDEFKEGSGPKKFFYNELKVATDNFSESGKLGHGGFGDVYKGFLLNIDVAIKRISRDSKQGIKEYATEVKIISQLRHRNLVQLIGWCHKKKDLLLIYEFMPNGSLDLHLYYGKSLLTWEMRYNIALDLASALLYLHEEWEQCVLHRDIKSSNIMLDSSFKAKLGDFGLARVVDHNKGSRTTVIAGTRGYIAPEYVNTGKASKESDIYSFGVVLLEIAGGRKPIDLRTEDEKTIIEWVWELYGLGNLIEVADPMLCGAFDEKQMEYLVVVGMWCAHPDHSCRPSITQVIQVLKFKAPLPFLPPKMPVPTYLPPTTIELTIS